MCICKIIAKRYTKERDKIEQEIREGHERLASARDKEPPPISSPASQETMPLRLFGDILTSRFSRARIVPEDEPPPSHS